MLLTAVAVTPMFSFSCVSKGLLPWYAFYISFKTAQSLDWSPWRHETGWYCQDLLGHNYGSHVPLVDFHFVNFIKSNAIKLWYPCWKSKIMKAFGNELTCNMVVVQSYVLYI